MKTIFAFLFILSFVFNSLSQSSAQDYEHYKIEISQIHKSIVDLTSASDLFDVTNFLCLYEKPTNCLPNALNFLSDSMNSDEDKMIVIYSLQKLSFDEYVKFETCLLSMAKNEKISAAFFNKAIFPGLDWNTQIQCGYEREVVKQLLASLAQSDSLSQENKDYVKSIASGEEYQKIKELIDAGVLRRQNSTSQP